MTKMTKMTKETATVISDLIQYTLMLEGNFDDVSMREFLAKTEDEQGFIKGWLAACDAMYKHLATAYVEPEAEIDLSKPAESVF